ncbi:MAG: thioredoxin domain-containing protein [Desulfovibrionaceae bacterium]
MSNALRHETSPYLLQHADNPVDWRPWGPAALAEARATDRPLFISIGYFACHWCHVMAHECFEDPEVAEVLNRVFVCVKVDREERPDVDDAYMAACQAMTGSGGWPLNVVAAPDGRPFWAGTYLPKHSAPHRPGLLDVARRIDEIWRGDRGRAEDVAARLTAHLAALETPAGNDEDADGPDPDDLLERAAETLAERYDPEHGGFGPAPRFPMPQNLLLLLRRHARSGDPEPLLQVERALDAMRDGGICDQLGGGFHRYATDDRWLLPHFEKMLYDQALLALAYLEAHQATGRRRFAAVAREIFAFARTELAGPEGGFCAALDADSLGPDAQNADGRTEEGRFYVWTLPELEAVLGPENAARLAAAYDCTAEGNFRDEATARRTGANILHLPRPVAETARRLGADPAAFAAELEDMRARLRTARAARPRPGRDHKVLCDWNGLMLAALARGARVLGDADLAAEAARLARFLLDAFGAPEGGLWHVRAGGRSHTPGFLDDYAALAWGLAELYQADFDPVWLAEARRLAREIPPRFGAAGSGALHRAEADPDLPLRRIEGPDGAMPSGDALAAWALALTGRLTGDAELTATARGVAAAFARDLERFPAAFAFLICALDLADPDAPEAVLTARDAAAAEPMLAALRPRWLPGLVVRLVTPETCGPLAAAAPGLAAEIGMEAARIPEGGPGVRARVCARGACRLPVTTPEALLRLLPE